MTKQVSDWLPPEVTTREPVRVSVAEAVAGWSEAWFGGSQLRASRFASARSELHVGDAGWRVYRKAVAVSCPKRAADRLLDLALDADVERLSLSSADRRLVTSFEDRLMQDLALRVETALGIAGEFADRPISADNPYGRFGGLRVDVADERDEALLSLAAPLEALLPACRASLSTPKRPAAKLDPIGCALASVPVQVEATLGAARIALTDLHSLAPGDVLVLDTALEDSATLALRGSAHVFASARITDDGGRMALTLQA